jgi:hypothetical protein
VKTERILTAVLLLDLLVVAAALALGHRAGDLQRHFGEHMAVTWLSFFKLLAVGTLSGAIYKARRRETEPGGWKSPALIWLLMAVGFVFLAIDEIALLHEGMDHRINELFGLADGPFSDRIDDAIVGAYGIAGLAVMFFYRRELGRFAAVSPYLAGGFLLLFLMVAFDTLSHRPDMIEGAALREFFKVAEDVLKLFGESFFLAAFAGCHTIARK